MTLTIGVLLLVSSLLAEELLARRGVTASGLGVDGLATVGAEPLSEGLPGVVDVVRGAVGVSASARS